MSHFRNLLKRAGITPEQLSEGTGMSIRTISYHYTTGRMPYVVLHKICKATGITMDSLVPPALAEYWNSLWDEAESLNKPRGRQKGWRKGQVAPLKRASGYKKVTEETWSKNLELTEPQHDQAPEETIHVEPEPTVSVVPKTVTPKKKPSIADLMAANPAPPAVAEAEPDFSGIDAKLFATSMDQVPRK